MTEIAGSPYVELRFDAAGKLADGDAAALATALAAPGIDNLVVLSHGWKFEPPGPRLLYEKMWPTIAANLDGAAGRHLVAGVVWPSKRYTTGIDAGTMAADPAAAGVLAAEGDSNPPEDLDDAALATALADALDGLADDDPATAAALAAWRADETPEAAEALLRAALAVTSVGTDDPELAAAGTELAALPDDIGRSLSLAAVPPRLEPTPEAAATLGLADAIRGLFAGPRAAVVRLLEQLSYFEMKTRAGVVGRALGGFLGTVQPPRPTRLHLVGHSFGARVVTAAAAAFTPTPNLSLFSLALLQGAFSHNGLSTGLNGAFSAVLGKPDGPIVISHTHNDWACTVMYALASRFSGDTTQGFGDKDDPFGAIGANGAQFRAPEAAGVTGAGPAFAPARGKVTNFRADGYISEHNDIANATVGKLVAAALRA